MMWLPTACGIRFPSRNPKVSAPLVNDEPCSKRPVAKPRGSHEPVALRCLCRNIQPPADSLVMLQIASNR